VSDTDQFVTSESTDMQDTAKEQAQNVAASAKNEAGNVVETAKEQAQVVTSDVREQAKQLTDEARSQLTDHAFAQRDNAVQSLRSIGDELTGMSDQAIDPGIGAQLTREVGGMAHKSADFLQEREPGQLVEEVREFARRRPGAFLIGAAAAGFLVGRVTRNAKSAHSSGSANGSSDGGRALVTPTAVDIYASPAGRPAVEHDSWGPESSTYPAMPPIHSEPGVVR